MKLRRATRPDSLIPIGDEQAKLGQELVRAVRDASGYFTDLLGDLPKDLLGLLIGDRVKAKRIERTATLWQRTRERLRDRGIPDPEPPSLKYAIPILQAAADEENDILQGLWSRLLAAAMDSNRRDDMHVGNSAGEQSGVRAEHACALRRCNWGENEASEPGMAS